MPTEPARPARRPPVFDRAVEASRETLVAECPRLVATASRLRLPSALQPSPKSVPVVAPEGQRGAGGLGCKSKASSERSRHRVGWRIGTDDTVVWIKAGAAPGLTITASPALSWSALCSLRYARGGPARPRQQRTSSARPLPGRQQPPPSPTDDPCREDDRDGTAPPAGAHADCAVERDPPAAASRCPHGHHLRPVWQLCRCRGAARAPRP
jgi:hypothetical protein